MKVVAGSQLLEREAEADALVEALEHACAGTGGLVVVEGAAGIGKTRLLQAARETAGRMGMRVLAGRGTELERDFPFGLVRQLFEPALHGVEPGERDELLAGAAAPAGPVVGIEPRDSETGAEGGLADPSFATLNALYWLTSNLAESAPTLLAVDDAHWADKASLRFFRFLVPRLEDLPVLLAVTARPSEPGADSELLDQLVADPVARVLRPGALSRTAVAELVRLQLSTDAEDDFCAASHEATAGNPFMLRELLVELTAEGSAGTAGEARRVRELAPATIQRAVLLRLARLPDDARRLGRAVAVLGDDADPRQARALAELDAQAAAVAADALVAAGILEPGRPLRFAHPLVRNAVYADLPGTEKAVAHRQAAKLLQSQRAEPERTAVHLLAADPDGDPEVVETLGAAAQRALDRAAPEAAIAYLRRGLVEPPDQGARRDLLRHLTTALLRAGDRSALEGLLSEIVEELSADSRSLMASAHELSVLLHASGRAEEGVALLERAANAAIEAGDYDLVMRFDSLIVYWARVPPGEQARRWDRYDDRIAPDTPGERIWLALRAWSAAFIGESASTVAELARRALEGGQIFREQPDSVVPVMAIEVLIRADELDLAEHVLAETRARDTGPAYIRGELAYVRGDIARAEPDARAAVEWFRQAGLLPVLPVCLAFLIDVLIERGELDAAEHELQASGMGGDMPDDYLFPALLHSRGCLRLAQGRTGQGLEDLFELGNRAQRHGTKNTALTPTAAVAAIALAGAGERESARGLAELYLGGAKAWGTARVIGIGLHALGVVEGGEKGIELMREAVATLEDSPARLEHAKALTDLGAALRRANRRAEARDPLREALEMARRGGALAVARRAYEELEATGEKLRPLMAGGVESLTPSERRVADMAAEGHSNREIAQALFLSVKTIEAHLSNTYRKLEVQSRRELQSALS